jgi:hypothetical protein
MMLAADHVSVGIAARLHHAQKIYYPNLDASLRNVSILWFFTQL